MERGVRLSRPILWHYPLPSGSAVLPSILVARGDGHGRRRSELTLENVRSLVNPFSMICSILLSGG